MDVARIEPFVELRLYRLCLGNLFGLEPASLEHVEEVGIAAGVELVGAIKADAAIGKEPRKRPMHDGRANLALDVVSDDRQSGLTEFSAPDLNGNRKHSH